VSSTCTTESPKSPEIADLLGETPAVRARMHDEQVDAAPEQVRALLRAQLPHLADLAIEPVPSSGTDNTLYRLGDELVVRLPLIEWAVPQIALEREWLPRLRPHLPVAIPEPLEVGEPGEGYPWPWAVYRWIDGEHPDPDADNTLLARDLAELVQAMHDVALDGVPRSGRGIPLRAMGDDIRGAIDKVADRFDAETLHEIWSDATTAPRWPSAFVPLHGDLSTHNLLLRDGRLHAVIDFSLFGLGDPAVDLEIAFSLFEGASRDAYRQALDVDDDTWRRARGWAVRGVYGIPYYEHTNPGIAERAARRVQAVLDDWRERR
jgi:aminoglycoside phosphotransferase (APT) family kinase protein